MPEQGRQITVASAAHAQVFYAHIDNHQQPRGINGPLFTRKVCGGSNMNGALLNPDDFHGRSPFEKKVDQVPWQALVGEEHLEEAWPGNPLGLNVRVPTPVRKGDAYRTGQHYRSKFDPLVAPTGSTINLQGTLVPGVANITGKVGYKVPKKACGTLGRELGAYKADASRFLLGHEKHPPLAFPVRYHYPDESASTKNAVPSREELAQRDKVLNAHTTPNFIIKNQVDCIVEGTRKKDPAKMLSKAQDRPKSMMHGLTFAPNLSKPPTFSVTVGPSAFQPQQPFNASSRKQQRRQPTLLERQLEAARRDDFEALLQGKNPQGRERIKKLATVVKLREALPQPALSPEPAPQKRALTAVSSRSASSRPTTQYTQYSDMTAMSGSTIYLQDDKLVKKMPFDVRRQLIREMKRKWDEINKEYQLLTLSLFNLDTVNKVTRKEYCEETMAKLEKEIDRLSKGHVYIEADMELVPAVRQDRPLLPS